MTIKILDHFVQLELGRPEDQRPYEGTGFEFELVGLGEDWQTIRAKTGVAAGPVEVEVAFVAAPPRVLSQELDHWDIAGEVSAIANGQVTVASVLESIVIPGLEHHGPVRVRCCAGGRHGHWDQSAEPGQGLERYLFTIWPESDSHDSSTVAKAEWAILTHPDDVTIAKTS